MLVSGGQNLPAGIVSLASTEIYTFLSKTWTKVGPMALPRIAHQLQTLASGSVLAIGGQSGNLATIYTSCELYSPATATWAPTGFMATSRYLHRAVTLQSGNILVAGGIGFPPTASCANCTTCPVAVVLNSTEIYNPTTGVWAPGADMPVARYSHTMVTLPSGAVLVTGGFVNSAAPGQPQNIVTGTSSLLYSEVLNAWTTTGSLVVPESDNPIGSTGVLFHPI